VKEKRFWFGVIASVIWLGYLAHQIFALGLPNDLNARGDVFAGFFAPLAFLWLVLGYLQQGEELKQSTEALRLQAEELKNSVEQQSQLVEVSRRQLQQELDAHADEKVRRAELARPIFVLASASYTSGTEGGEYEFTVTNTGNTATNTLLEYESVEHGEHRVSLGHMPREKSRQFTVALKYDEPVVLTISYIDSTGAEGVASAEVSAKRTGPKYKDVFEKIM